MAEEERIDEIDELRRRKKSAQGRWLALLSGGLFASAMLALMSMGVAAGLALVATLIFAVENRRRLLMIDLELARAELEEFATKEAKLNEEEIKRQREERESSVAGIEFNSEGGVYDGRPIYLFALKDGRRYEYAGLVRSVDEPSPTMLLVNGLAYSLIEK